MANIKDVAQLAGVSTSTVSRALSGKVIVNANTKRRVFDAVKQLNYQPNALAKGLKEGRTKTIALVIPNLKNLVFPSAIRGITDVAKKNGYTIVLCNTDEDLAAEQADVNNLLHRVVDGFIFFTATAQSMHIQELAEQGYPVVLLFRNLPEAPIDSVVVNNHLGAYQATKFLLERGYQKIGLINGAKDLPLYRERYHGYKQALEDSGRAVDPDYVIWEADGWEDGYQAMKTILQKGRESWPDAVFATSDPKALGVIKAIREAGLTVPEDLAVMGFDNLDMSELMDPPLTTVAQPFYEAGTAAAERLIELIVSKRQLKHVTIELDPDILVRQSVGHR